MSPETGARPTAALIVVASEVLSGKVKDENTPFVVAELRKLGVRLERVVILPDDAGAIASEVREAAERFDFVLTAGGVGPTHDDVTMDGVAAAFGRGVERSEVLVAALEHIRRDRPAEALLRLCTVPKGCGYFYGPGSERWPTVHVENVYVLPGVPSFLRSRFEGLRDLLRSRPFFTGSVYCARGELALLAFIDATVGAFRDVDVGSYPCFLPSDYRVRVTFDGPDRARIEQAMEHFLAQMPAEDVVRVEDPAE